MNLIHAQKVRAHELKLTTVHYCKDMPRGVASGLKGGVWDGVGWHQYKTCDSGLPCFKPETMLHFRQRFVLEKNERDAAEFMKGLVQKSYGALSTKGYDQFQLLTNGIPY